MANGFVQVAPDSTGKKVDNEELSVGGQTVYRQRIVLASPSAAAAVAEIATALPGASDPALVVREVAQGQATMAASRPVVIASDQSAIPTVRSETDLGATYQTAFAATAPAAAPTDFVVLRGSATKTVRIRRIFLTGAATSAGHMPVQVIRRSSADLGGSSVTLTPAKLDANSPAATAAVTLFTANPATLGTTVAVIDAGRITLVAAASLKERMIFEYGALNEQALVLRGTSDFVAVNFNGAAVPSGGAFEFAMLWTED